MKFEFYTHYRAYVVIFALFITKAAMSFGLYGPYWADNSLFPCGSLGPCPAYFLALPVKNPEGWLWFLMNPIQWGPQLYMIWVFFFDLGMTILQLKITRIPRVYIMFHQIITMFAYGGYGHEYQNVTIMAFMPFMYLNPWIGVIPLLMKLPIGPWAFWNINDPHVQCALHCGGDYSNFWNFLVHFSNDYSLMLTFLMPLLFRWKFKHKQIKYE